MIIEKENKKNKNKSIGLKVVSIILAVLLWFYVIDQGNMETGSNSVEVELKYHHLAEDLNVNGPETVNIKLWGVFQESADLNLSASVDLLGLEEGTYELPVNVDTVKGAMFTSVQPDKVKVTLEQVEEFGMPVSFKIKQNPPAGYELIEIIAVPEKCIIKGTEEYIKNVSSIICPIELGNIKESCSFSCKVLPADADGTTVDKGIIMIPDTVDVYVIINQKMETKKVNIKPMISGETEEGYNVVQTVVNPDNVNVFGSESRVLDVNELTTDRIDITGRKESFEQETQIIVPEGVRVYPSGVSVYVEISKEE